MLGAFGEPADEPYTANSETVAQCDRMVRMGFIRKVYGILAVQILATGIMCAMAMKMTASEQINGWTVLSMGSVLASSTAIRVTVFVLSLVLLFALFCLRHQYPMNMALLSAWTFAMAMSVATSCIYGMCDPMVIPADGGGPLPFSIANNAKVLLYGGAFHCAVGTQRADDGANAVIMAAMITATIFFSLTAFTMQSKIDFSFLGAGLFACTVILMLFGIGMAIFGASANLYYGYCVAGAIIFSLYIIFDTYMIHNRLGPGNVRAYIHHVPVRLLACMHACIL